MWLPCFQDSVSAAIIKEARARCKRLRSQVEVDGVEMSVWTLDALVAACTAAMSSPVVAEELASTICVAIDDEVENQLACGANGAMEAVIAALARHGAFRAEVASQGCDALRCLVTGVTVFADALLLSTRGLDAICSAITAHPRAGNVQLHGCEVLCKLAEAASPAGLAVMRDAGTVNVLSAANGRLTGGGPREDEAKEMVETTLTLLAETSHAPEVSPS